MFNFTDFFGVSSPLKSFLSGFRPRQGQANMSEDVMYAIENKQRLIIEAGTGIGKTFAYLVPALVSGKKIIISTGKIAKQAHGSVEIRMGDTHLLATVVSNKEAKEIFHDIRYLNEFECISIDMIRLSDIRIKWLSPYLDSAEWEA